MDLLGTQRTHQNPPRGVPLNLKTCRCEAGWGGHRTYPEAAAGEMELHCPWTSRVEAKRTHLELTREVLLHSVLDSPLGTLELPPTTSTALLLKVPAVAPLSVQQVRPALLEVESWKADRNQEGIFLSPAESLQRPLPTMPKIAPTGKRAVSVSQSR